MLDCFLTPAGYELKVRNIPCALTPGAPLNPDRRKLLITLLITAFGEAGCFPGPCNTSEDPLPNCGVSIRRATPDTSAPAVDSELETKKVWGLHLVVTVGDTIRLTYEGVDGFNLSTGDHPKWSSSDESIATVERFPEKDWQRYWQALLVGRKPGTAMIRLRVTSGIFSSKHDSVTVTVTPGSLRH